MVAMPSLFDRLERAPAVDAASKQETSHLIERLLTWLTHNWTKDTITARQLTHYGPYPIRNETKATLELAQELVARGWLIPLRPRRHDARVWKIGRPQLEQTGAGVRAG
jgi:hypothetical protein